MKIFNILLVIGFSIAILADDSCIFEHPTEGVINLASLGLQTGQPRFRDITSYVSDSFTYSFNPCYSFSENGCQNAAICQLTPDRLNSYKLAIQNNSKWTLDSDKLPVLTYTFGEKAVSITMICSGVSEEAFEILGEYTSNHYYMRLRSHCACWNGCGSPRLSTTTKRTPATTHTTYSSACRYTDSRHGTIDLSSIGSMTGKPRFKDMSTINPDNFVWSYNPCYKFSENTCQDVAGCQIDRAHGVGYAIGLQEYAYWVNMNNTKNIVPWIIYPSPRNNRRLSVQLICDRSISTHSLKIIGETSPGEYVMALTSRCACWDGCAKPAPRPTPFSRHFWMIASIVAGSVFLLFCMCITCLFCSKPKRAQRTVIINEKTPFFKSINNHNY